MNIESVGIRSSKSFLIARGKRQYSSGLQMESLTGCRTNNFSLQRDMRISDHHRWNGHKTFYHCIECFSLLWLFYLHTLHVIRSPSRLLSDSLRVYVSSTVATGIRITYIGGALRRGETLLCTLLFCNKVIRRELQKRHPVALISLSAYPSVCRHRCTTSLFP